LANQLATPGLGSLMAGRWIVGIGQLVLFLIGCVMITMYFFQLDLHAYRQVIGEFGPDPHKWLGEIGLFFFVTAWFWALVTSISLVTQAKLEEPARPQTVPSPTGSPPAEPPKLEP
jgi:hypothetical protein